MTLNTLASPTQNKTAVEKHEQALLVASDLCRVFEGFRAKPYLCPAGVPTIGYGSTRYPDGTPIKMTDKAVTKAMADIYLFDELSKLLPWVIALCPTLSGKRLAAILDFAYNLGIGRLRASTLRKRINAREWEGAKAELLKWNKGGGRVLPGLVKRRETEVKLFQS